MRRRWLALAVSAFSTAACAVGPNYKRPPLPSPPSYRFQSGPSTAASLADVAWWNVFRDDALRVLIDEALLRNFDLLIAIARVDEARAQAQAAGAALLPSLSATGTGSYGNSFQGAGALPTPFYSASGTGVATWELDVFGRLRRTREAARAEYAASEEAQRGVWVTVVAEVAQTYFQLLALDVQRTVSERTVASRVKTLDFFRVRAEGGIGTDLDVARGEADLAGARATLADLGQRIAVNEDALSLLLGRPPGPIARAAPTGVLAAPPPVPAGLPSQLVERRPDIRQAEANLVAANARVGVSTANLFPTFTLTALGGVASSSLGFVSGSGGARGAYGVSGEANWLAPFLQGASLRYQLEAAKDEWRAVRITYVKTTMAAFKDVADTLVTLERLREERAESERQVNALRRAIELAGTQFQGGTATYLDVINADQQLFPAELNLAQIEGMQLTALVQLYRSLGGGWWLAPREDHPARDSSP